MDFQFDGEFKSLTKISLDGLPDFVVLTGMNGTGKSQLLELVERAVTSPGKFGTVTAREPLRPEDVLRLTSEWTNLANATPVGLQVVQQQFDILWSQFSNYASGGRVSQHLVRSFDEFTKSTGRQKSEVTKDEFTSSFDISTPQAQNQIFNQTIGAAFVDYRIRQVEAAESGSPLNSTPPWELLSDIIKGASLPFEFRIPSSIRTTFTFELTHKTFGRQVPFVDLSSGEKVLLSLCFWLFHAQRSGGFPRLLLLDEPDAHLHASMCKQFLDTIANVLVRKHGVTVVTTTHNPATVSLSPRGSLYEMRSEEPRVLKVDSKSEAVSRLTSGHLSLTGTKLAVLVEDEDDEDFYGRVYAELLAENLLSAPGRELIFLQASKPRRSSNRSGPEGAGGKSVVKKWVSKFSLAGLDTVAGLVDRDVDGDSSEDGVYAIDRHCLESYLVDPLCVYGALVESDFELDVPSVPALTKHRTHKLVGYDESQLQKIADLIVAYIEEAVPEAVETTGSSATEAVTVEYLNGVSISVPRWYAGGDGKKILRAAIDTFGGNNVNHRMLFDSFFRIFLVPRDLCEMFDRLTQTGPVD